MVNMLEEISGMDEFNKISRCSSYVLGHFRTKDVCRKRQDNGGKDKIIHLFFRNWEIHSRVLSRHDYMV